MSCCRKPNLIKNKYISNLISIIAIYLGISFYFSLNDLFQLIKYSFTIEDKNKYYEMLFSIFSSLAQSIGMLIGGILEYKINYFYTTLTGLLISLISIIIIFFVYKSSVFYIFGVIWGLGVGISVSLLRKNLILFSPNKKGLTLSFVRIINTIFYAVVLYVINVYIIYSLGSFLFYSFIGIIIGLILFGLFSWEYKKEDEINVNEEMSNQISESNQNNDNHLNEKEALDKLNNLEEELDRDDIKSYVINIMKTLRFWRIVIISILLNFPLSLISSSSLYLANNFNFLTQSALKFILIFPLVVLLLSPLIGYFSDKKSHLLILIIISGINIIPFFLLIFFIKNEIIFCITFAINELSINGLYISFLSYIMEIYGIQESAIINGIIDIFPTISLITRAIIIYKIGINYKNEVEDYFNQIKKLYIPGPICCTVALVLLIFERKIKLLGEQKNFN